MSFWQTPCRAQLALWENKRTEFFFSRQKGKGLTTNVKVVHSTIDLFHYLQNGKHSIRIPLWLVRLIRLQWLSQRLQLLVKTHNSLSHTSKRNNPHFDHNLLVSFFVFFVLIRFVVDSLLCLVISTTAVPCTPKGRRFFFNFDNSLPFQCR